MNKKTNSKNLKEASVEIHAALEAIYQKYVSMGCDPAIISDKIDTSVAKLEEKYEI